MDNTLPLFVVPKSGELFSSWLFRLSYNHYQKTYSFYKNEFGTTTNWTGDIDRLAPDELLVQLANRTPYTIEELQQLTLSSLNEKLFLKDNPNGINKWILSGGFRSRTIQRAYLNYCPNCFSKGRVFFQIEWRLALFNSCSYCGTVLENSCRICGTFVNTFRTDVGRKSFNFNLSMSDCGNCGNSLTHELTLAADDHLIHTENKFRRIIETGIHEHFRYSFIYFDVLYQVVRCLIRLESETSRKSIQDFDPKTRARLILRAADLLEAFPMNLSLFAKAEFLSASFWLRDFSPDWFYYTDQVTWNLNKLRLTAFG